LHSVSSNRNPKSTSQQGLKKLFVLSSVIGDQQNPDFFDLADTL